MSKRNHIGKNNPMYGRCAYDIWLEKYGKGEADKRQEIANNKNRENQSDKNGKNNPMYGKTYYDIWLKKYGKEEADKRQKEKNKKINGKNNPMFGKYHTEESKKKNSEKHKGEKHPMFGKHHTKETKRILREIKIGKNNPMYGKTYYDIWLKKYGRDEADWRQRKLNKKRRLNRIKEIEKNKLNGNQLIPSYNPKACRLIDEYNKQHGFNFQHAENGGEICIDGYYPDGTDEQRKTIIEVDEKYHFNSDDLLKKRDIERQKYLENLGYTVIRVRI